MLMPYPIPPSPILCPALSCPSLPCPAVPCPALPCPALRSVTHHSSPPSALSWHLPSTLYHPLPYPPTCRCPALHHIVCYAIPLPCSYSCNTNRFTLPPTLLDLMCPPPCPWHDATLTSICAILVPHWTQFWPCPLSCALPSHMPPAHPVPYSSLPSCHPRPTLPCQCSCLILHYNLPL